MSQSHASNDSRPITLRPRPGQTELNWREWLLLLGIIVVSLVICAAAGRSILKGFAEAIPSPTPTPKIIAPTVTLIPTPTSAPTPTPTPAIPDAIGVGGYVEVVDGVNFRTDANTSAQIIRTLGGGEVLEVIGGPSNDGNLIWWQLRDPNNVEGWAAADYLKPAPPPR